MIPPTAGLLVIVIHQNWWRKSLIHQNQHVRLGKQEKKMQQEHCNTGKEMNIDNKSTHKTGKQEK